MDKPVEAECADAAATAHREITDLNPDVLKDVAGGQNGVGTGPPRNTGP